MDSLAAGDAGGAAASAQLRPRLLAALDGAVEYGNRHQRDRDKGQAQLFGGGEDGGDGARRRAAPARGALDRGPAARPSRRRRSGCT